MTDSVPDVDGYVDLRALGGGAGETFLARRAGSGEDCVLRVYGVGTRRRGPEAPEVQAGVLRLVHGLVPAPTLVEYRRAGPGIPHGLLATSRLPGIPLSEVLADADDGLQTTLGHALGNVLGRLSGLATTGPGGFRDRWLRLGGYPVDSESLVTWVDHHRPGTALADLDEAEVASLRALAERGDRLLAVSHRACLVHGDLTTRNVLADRAGGTITGLVDWEFAHGGHPVEDLGALLRHDGGTPFGEAVVAAMTPWLPVAERAAPRDLLERARAADLYWLVEAAARRGQGPTTESAFELVRAIARAGDLLAEA